jgi:hypothetical protein
MILLSDNVVLDTLASDHVDNGFMEGGDAVGSNHIVLASSETRWSRRGWAQTTSALKS